MILMARLYARPHELSFATAYLAVYTVPCKLAA